MRIVHIITKLDVGGAQETAIRSCAGLAARGHQVTLITGPEVGTNGELHSRASELAVTTVVVPSLVRAIRPVRDLRALAALSRQIQSLRPDVVQTHSSKAGVLGRVAARLRRVPLVVHTVHGWSFREGQGKAQHALYLSLERRLARSTDVLAVVTEVDREVGLAASVGTAAQYRLVRSGIDLEEWTPKPGARAAARAVLGLTDEDFVVGAVMRLAPPKDPVTLVHAVGKLGEGAVLVVIGAGDLRAEVEAAAERQQARVVLTGPRADVPQLIHAFDVAVLSSWSEGLPRSVVEAMAAGRPVVATDVGGIREVVDDGVDALLVPAGDATAMADAIARLRSDADLARSIAAAASRRVAEFGVSAMVDALEQVYREALVDGPRTGG